MIKSPFRRSSRIRKPQDFAEVKRRGLRVKSGPVTLTFLSGKEQKLGIITTRRIGGAVVRNRIRRVIREFFRINRELFPKGECVFLLGVGVACLANKEITERLRLALKKLVSQLGQ